MAPTGGRFVVAVLTIIAALVILFLFIASPAAGSPQTVLTGAVALVPGRLLGFGRLD